LNLILKFAPTASTQSQNSWEEPAFFPKIPSTYGYHPLIILILCAFADMKVKENDESLWWGISPVVMKIFWENCISFPAFVAKIYSHSSLKKLFLGTKINYFV
jgi:hypothetical protein